jgi:hypothetical protein
MDRYFYSVEMDGDRKVVHMSGNIYYNDGDESEFCCRIAEWTFLYITLEELKDLLRDVDVFWEYLNERVKYIGNLTEYQAIATCNVYFNGSSGEKLHISQVNEDTPCGDYWFE